MRAAVRALNKPSFQKWTIPGFLCPFFESAKVPTALSRSRLASWPWTSQCRCLHVEDGSPIKEDVVPPLAVVQKLPLNCPGCGAYTQTLSPQEAGFYPPTQKRLRNFLASQQNSDARVRQEEEAAVYSRTISGANASLLESLGLDSDSLAENDLQHNQSPSQPLCDRCHNLLHHHRGVSIIHPTIDSIQDIISESPYNYNHIYHVLDAADFPLSLIPQLHQHLSLMPQRSQNRRAKHSKFHHGRKAEMSFIITRSDLLAPKKEQVDTMMSYLIQVLRDALGSSGKDVRLGNVRCVSAKRGWWTRQVKEDVWKRGGGGWMVGKVNVGKSNLFECIFPKGRNEDINSGALRNASLSGTAAEESPAQPVSAQTEIFDQQGLPVPQEIALEDFKMLDESSLLPPAPEETDYPPMPIVSSLPGTTASPIRLPFGGGKGELIDLPGLSRGNLEDFVKDEHKMDLVMKRRIVPQQHSIKSGQSLLIGGLVRITPSNTDAIILACPFVPLDCHVTSTEKAIAIHTQEMSSGVSNMAREGTGERMKSAGCFELQWDVTKQRTGPLTASNAVGLKASVLPFKVLSVDILIESCGWVELAVQVRKRDLEKQRDESGAEAGKLPMVEVFSPDGRYIGVRRPMNAWAIGGPRKAASKRQTRPRRSMKGVKKNLKKIARSP